ncbi:ABC transporter permease [Polymorphum gilvum]|uniref:ABC-type transport system, permease component n=1 Tax=Polymorphum gilvum (strain LMG 25793 / CGMCC 1.9160 / SL003B-26A1) TaxID=991905 RepID=F2J0P5_POLGS|nr:ABC transporter permease [Polymorphum gilvum]ADZ70731.1 ABC-type transport system, permease component [Polymorphum gilvum SL003B-26A1]
MRRLKNIFRLGVKELYSLKRDLVLLILIGWAFSAGIYVAAVGRSADLHNTSIAIVDEDRSQLSARILQAFLPPDFKEPEIISFRDIDAGLDTRKYSFVLVIPARFEADLRAGLQPQIQVNIDATTIMQAGTGANFIANVLTQEIRRFSAERGETTSQPLNLVTRYAFNPNLDGMWFGSVMEIINNVTMLTIILTGAAVIREREHGTLEHLLVMPLSPFEIMMAKVWANGFVIIIAVAFSLWIVVEQLLAVPIAGSVPLFLAGATLYLFFASALGILLATVTRSMPQFALLFILIILPMMLLSGAQTPLESQPVLLQSFMRLVPSTQFVSFAQAILYRGAGFDIVWPQFLAVTVVGIALFAFAALRFRRSIATSK